MSVQARVGALPGGVLDALNAQLRKLIFDPTIFALMIFFCAMSIVSALYVSYTSLRYVFEIIGGMPWEVASAAPFTVDGTVGAGIMAEWWLIGRRHRNWWPFTVSLTVGLAFAVITVLGNAAHGALVLTVQQPIVLHLGGMTAYLPWWIPIAVSAVPGLALFCSSYMTTLVIGVWRGERAEREAQRLQQEAERSAALASAGPIDTPALAQRPVPLDEVLAAVAKEGVDPKGIDTKWIAERWPHLKEVTARMKAADVRKAAMNGRLKATEEVS